MHAMLEAVMAKIGGELEGLDTENATAFPHGKEWNIQQVIEHMILTSRFTAATLEARLAKGRISRNQARTLLQRLLQIMTLSFAYLPQGSPPLDETAPTGTLFPALAGRELGRLLRHEMETMDQTLDRCRRKFGMERVAPHPIFGPMRVDQWRRWSAVHAAHHLKQIRRLRMAVAPQLAPERPRGVALAFRSYYELARATRSETNIGVYRSRKRPSQVSG